MTTPNDPAYENQPQHWNQPHAFTINATGSEISNAFSNANGLSFGLSAGALTGSYTVPSVPSVTEYFSRTNTTFNGANISGSITNNTNGFQLSLSVAPGGGGADGYNILAAGTQTANTTGTVLFVDSNGISFGMSNNSRITASYTVPAQSNQTGGIYHVGNTTGQSSSSTYDLRTLSIDGAGIVSAGWSNGTVRISATQSNQAWSGSNASSTFQTLVFNNANGVSWSNNAGSVQASYSRNVASNAIQAVGSATGSGTNTSRFAADDHVHAGVFSIGVSTAGNTIGDTRVDVGRFVLQGGNNVTLSQITAANALNTIVISGGAAGGADGVNAFVVNGGVSTASTTLTLSNSNNVSFGHNAGVITATASFNQTNQSAIRAFGVSNTGQTAGNTGVSTGIDWVLAGSQSITLSQSTAGGGPNTVWIQHPAWLTTAMQSNAATISNIRISAGTTSNLLSAFTFNDANGLSFGLNASTITGSYSRPVVSNAIQSVGSATGSGTNTSRFAADDHVHAGVFSMGVSNLGNTSGDTRVDVGRFVLQGGNNITLSQVTAANALNTIIVSAGAGGGGETRVSAYAVSNTTQSTSGTIPLSLLSFQGNGIVSAGISNGSVVISATQSNQAVSNSAGSFTFQTLNFSNANNVTWGTSAGGIITASVAAPGAAAENNWVNLLGANTAGNTTASGSTIGYSGINLTLSGTNGSVVNISAPATSSLVGTNGISISTNGSTISISNVLYTHSGYAPYKDLEMITVATNQATLSVFPLDIPNIQFDRLQWIINNTNSSNSSGSHSLSFRMGIYTRNASTLSLLTSTSASFALTHSGTAGSYSLYSGMRLMSAGLTTTLTEGKYWVAFNSNTTSGGTNGSYSLLGVSNIASNFVGFWSSSHNTTYQLTLGQGIYTASTTAIPGSIAFSQIRGSDSGAFRFPAIQFGSSTV